MQIVEEAEKMANKGKKVVIAFLDATFERKVGQIICKKKKFFFFWVIINISDIQYY
jgi:hypothetical protein